MTETITWEPTGAERAEAEQIVARLRAVRAERSRLDAEEARLLAAALGIAVGQVRRAGGASDWDMPVRSMAAEIAAALREGPRTVERRMGEADALVHRFPATLAALDAGRLSGRHAAVLVAEGIQLGDVEARAGYEQRALRVAESSTVAALKPMCRALADSADLVAAAARHDAARAQRHVRVCTLGDGMAELRVIAPVPLVQGVHDRLTTMARTVIAERDREPLAGEAPGDGEADVRGVDALRADLACSLLLSGAPSSAAIGDESGRLLLDDVRGVVQVVIPVRVLTESPGGSGAGTGLKSDTSTIGGEPVDALTARRIASAAPRWDRLFQDPDTGALQTVDHYLPTAAQRRYLHARDEHCRFPGCRQSARRSEADHIVPYAAGGRTAVDNLETLCKRHHMLKHHSPWRVRHLGAGELEWTSPLGYRYRGQPVSAVRFTESDERSTHLIAHDGGDDPPWATGAADRDPPSVGFRTTQPVAGAGGRGAMVLACESAA